MIDIGPNSNRLLYSLPIQATASRDMFSTRTARRAHMTELTRVGLTCRAFARAGSTGGSHDRAHKGSGSHAGHSRRRSPPLPLLTAGCLATAGHLSFIPVYLDKCQY